jgi:pimeloyl-ACP methyl ester carboxylesterase
MSELELACNEYGDGKPVLILHGLFGSARNWHSIARRLGERHKVYAVDLRNHGGSPWADEMGYLDLAADVRAFIERQGLDRPAVIGHSMGGKAAMCLALQHAERIDRLAVLDIAPVDYDHSHSEFIEAMQSVDPDLIERRAEADALLSKTVPEAPVRQFLLQNLVAKDEGFAWRINLTALATNLDRILAFPRELANARYDGLSLFLHGAVSDYVLPQHVATIERHFPRTRYEAVSGTGHWLHAERPDVVLGHLSRFLE